ncbi:MAG: type VI secretion system lipoprotein TssJ [Gammaproteobacteria bacterium]|nr:type VI secretion system lipoprotein TssJ [Gammaproteobacteria bacterium]
MLLLNKFKTLYILTLVLVLSSCAAVNSGVGGYLGLDTDLEVVFSVDADINPDEKNRPSPLFIRMYELKSPKMFNKSDFIGLYERDAELLGADLVASHKLKRLKPGEGRSDHFVLNKDTKYVAFYAEFLKYKNSKYRLVMPVTQNNIVRTTVALHVASNKISNQDNTGY